MRAEAGKGHRQTEAYGNAQSIKRLAGSCQCPHDHARPHGQDATEQTKRLNFFPERGQRRIRERQSQSDKQKSEEIAVTMGAFEKSHLPGIQLREVMQVSISHIKSD